VSAGVKAISIHKRLVLDKRENSANWYARLSLENGTNIRRSTKTADLELAKEIALKIYYETEARIANNLPASTRKFRHAAEHTIKRMNEDLEAGEKCTIKMFKKAHQSFTQCARYSGNALAA